MNDGTGPAVVVDGVSKAFRLPREQIHTLKEKALHPFRRQNFDELRALRDVSLSVRHGEFFGIVGRNGSGKSTLLKCLAGIYRVDRGQIYVDGRLSTFIELGVGFNPDLAARDNILLNATMLGLSPREARRRFDRVIDFAELHEFVDLKLKNYSSGMMVRLAFSVMIQVDADILLIDEVLAVGDAAFQQKCFDEFGRIRRSGTTVLLVTHDMGAVQRFCDRAMLLEHGRVVETGDVQRVADRYLQLNFSAEARAEVAAGEAQATVDSGAEPEGPADADAVARDKAESLRLGDRRAEIVDGWVEDADGGRAEAVTTGMPCTVAFVVRFHERVEDPVVGIDIFNSQDDKVLASQNLSKQASGTFGAGDELLVRATFENMLVPDHYWVTPSVAKDVNALQWHDRRHNFISVMVTGNRAREGVVALPHTLTVERTGAAQEQLT